LLLPALFIGVGWFACDWYKRNHLSTTKRINLSGYKYISPLLDYELPPGYNVRHEPIPFKRKVEEFVAQQIQTGKITEMSVYFRDLSDGPWFGINENINYNPASMMKVPIMAAWLKRSENDKSVLRQKLMFDEKVVQVPEQTIKPEQSIKSGISYTVEELLRHMMIYSDNKALWLLETNLNPGEYELTLSQMGVANTQENGHDSITVHGYSGFLRILFNASFLSKEMSEKALELMSHQDFPQGIAAGIPDGTTLASKFGEFSNEKHPGIIQLHEFGIVYHPKGPYILGILTIGSNWKEQADIIKSVSELVYNSVKLQK